MAHDARSVANRLMDVEDGICMRPLTPMQVIKLVYISHGWMLGLYGRSLINQEVEAWPYGPVISDLYQALKKHGAREATEGIAVEEDADFDPIETNLIEQVQKKYGGLHGLVLSRLTHSIGSPWYITKYESDSPVIPNELIQKHYARMAKNA